MKRYWVLDFARGLAVILMAVFHLVFLSWYFFEGTWDPFSGGWPIVGRAASTTFLVVAGTAWHVAYQRQLAANNTIQKVRDHIFKRGVKVFSMGMLVTLATFVVVPDGTVIFGILHLMGVAIILSWFVVRTGGPVWLVAVFVIIAGLIMNQIILPINWLAAVGIPGENFSSLDYFPIFPHWGTFLLGIAVAQSSLWHGVVLVPLPKTLTWVTSAIITLGQHSLLFYILHVPLLWLALQFIATSTGQIF